MEDNKIKMDKDKIGRINITFDYDKKGKLHIKAAQYKKDTNEFDKYISLDQASWILTGCMSDGDKGIFNTSEQATFYRGKYYKKYKFDSLLPELSSEFGPSRLLIWKKEVGKRISCLRDWMLYMESKAWKADVDFFIPT